MKHRDLSSSLILAVFEHTSSLALHIFSAIILFRSSFRSGFCSSFNTPIIILPSSLVLTQDIRLISGCPSNLRTIGAAVVIILPVSTNLTVNNVQENSTFKSGAVDTISYQIMSSISLRIVPLWMSNPASILIDIQSSHRPSINLSVS